MTLKNIVHILYGKIAVFHKSFLGESVEILSLNSFRRPRAFDQTLLYFLVTHFDWVIYVFKLLLKNQLSHNFFSDFELPFVIMFRNILATFRTSVYCLPQRSVLSTELNGGAVCAEILRVRERERERASATPAQKLQNSHGPRMRQNLRKKRLYARNLDSPLLSPQPPTKEFAKLPNS